MRRNGIGPRGPFNERRGWISEDARGFKTLTVIGFEGLAVEALRDLREEKDAEIDALTPENQELRERLEALEQAVAALTENRKG